MQAKTDIAATAEATEPDSWVRLRELGNGHALTMGGDWTINQAAARFADLEAITLLCPGPVSIDLGAVGQMDTIGAWLIYRTARRFGAEKRAVAYTNLSSRLKSLLGVAAANDDPCLIEPEQGAVLPSALEELGIRTVSSFGNFARGMGFIGAVFQSLVRCIANPFRLRFTSLVYHMEHVGLRALPIVGLISFLIGIVIAYLGAQQLRQFGAEIFVVDLLAIAVLRELGVLITAIVIAGRSGSAFTAQIGSMKLNEEVDAMRVLGLDPMELLVIPRSLALLFTMPLLTFFADMMGLLGGGLMCWLALDISPGLFLELLNDSLTNWTFAVGMIKAPVFALVIANAGCYEGLSVSGSAESVGRRTTKSVVESIFLIIVLSAVFSIFFATLGI